MPTLTWTPEPKPKHTGPTDKSWAASVGQDPWCVCGKRTTGFCWVYEHIFYDCSRCKKPCAKYNGHCKTKECAGISLCTPCLRAQQVPRENVH